MPYKHIEKKIPEEYDRRVKLLKHEREEIKRLYGKVSQRKLAKAYGVSRRLIQFIGDPEKRKQNLLRRKENGGSKVYYDKVKWRKQMKRHRHHKQELYVQGKLLDKPEGGKSKNEP